MFYCLVILMFYWLVIAVLLVVYCKILFGWLLLCSIWLVTALHELPNALIFYTVKTILLKRLHEFHMNVCVIWHLVERGRLSQSVRVLKITNLTHSLLRAYLTASCIIKYSSHRTQRVLKGTLPTLYSCYRETTFYLQLPIQYTKLRHKILRKYELF